MSGSCNGTCSAPPPDSDVAPLGVDFAGKTKTTREDPPDELLDAIDRDAQGYVRLSWPCAAASSNETDKTPEEVPQKEPIHTKSLALHAVEAEQLLHAMTLEQVQDQCEMRRISVLYSLNKSRALGYKGLKLKGKGTMIEEILEYDHNQSVINAQVKENRKKREEEEEEALSRSRKHPPEDNSVGQVQSKRDNCAPQ